MAGDNLANIDLTTSEEDMIRLFMQTADFYIFGYKNRRENGVWEMKLEDTPANRNQGDYKIRIRDSEAIGIDEGYTNLLKLDLSYFAFTEVVNESVLINDPLVKIAFKSVHIYSKSLLC